MVPSTSLTVRMNVAPSRFVREDESRGAAVVRARMAAKARREGDNMMV